MRAILLAAMAMSIACRDEVAAPEMEVRPGGRPRLLSTGQEIFRHDTFGNETFWTDTLRIHEAILAQVTPNVAFAVGLKVDVDALPAEVKSLISSGLADLNSTETTVLLLKLDAVVGLHAEVSEDNQLLRVGTTCALCHSTVDNSFGTGIGKRLDAWPNLDLDPGRIISLSEAITPAQRAVYSSWGPGRYDPRFNFDGINGPVVIPPAYGLRGVNSVTYTGDGDDIAYWNRYVGITQMHGHGSFSEPRTGVSVNNPPDLISSKLDALEAYQLSLEAPGPPKESERGAVGRGRAVFVGAGKCVDCHSGGNLTDANERLHAPSEVVSEPEPGGVPGYASRSATKKYRTTPLRALVFRGPYFHNGIATSLAAVVDLYDSRKGLGLTTQQKADLVAYLRSL